MRFEALAYFNQRPVAMLEGYLSGDALVATRLGLREVEAATPERAADVLFCELNADDRPNGWYERSLSIGDVVRVDVPPGGDGTGYQLWLACAFVGWDRVAEPAGDRTAVER